MNIDLNGEHTTKISLHWMTKIIPKLEDSGIKLLDLRETIIFFKTIKYQHPKVQTLKLCNRNSQLGSMKILGEKWRLERLLNAMGIAAWR